MNRVISDLSLLISHILWVMGVIYIVLDAYHFGSYTGIPNTFLGWIGTLFLAVMIVPLFIIDLKSLDK